MRSSPEPASFAPRFNGDFGGPNVEASPYPSMANLSRFGTVSRKTHWQALTGLSWLSYSRPSDLPMVPGLDHRFRLLPGWKLPTPARLNEPNGSSPLDRILHLL
jgi:hypothetical protein